MLAAVGLAWLDPPMLVALAGAAAAILVLSAGWFCDEPTTTAADTALPSPP